MALRSQTPFAKSSHLRSVRRPTPVIRSFELSTKVTPNFDCSWRGESTPHRFQQALGRNEKMTSAVQNCPFFSVLPPWNWESTSVDSMWSISETYLQLHLITLNVAVEPVAMATPLWCIPIAPVSVLMTSTTSVGLSKWSRERSWHRTSIFATKI